MIAVLFCADPLAPHRVDPYFNAQAQAVRDLGGHVALIDHDALLAGQVAAAVRRVPEGTGPWWYRGWMMPADAYQSMSEWVNLAVDAASYRAAHELPGWYATFAELTPESRWRSWRVGTVPEVDDVAQLVEPFGGGPAIVKDYVKSRKHEWSAACHIPDLADLDHATAVVRRMVELQDDSLNGGIVVRRFERFHGTEARVWWINGEPVLVTAHPDTPAEVPEPDLTAVTPAVAALGCRFVTTDIASHEDGRWRVVEVGDGQVSDVPPGADELALLMALSRHTL